MGLGKDFIRKVAEQSSAKIAKERLMNIISETKKAESASIEEDEDSTKETDESTDTDSSEVSSIEPAKSLAEEFSEIVKNLPVVEPSNAVEDSITEDLSNTEVTPVEDSYSEWETIPSELKLSEPALEPVSTSNTLEVETVEELAENPVSEEINVPAPYVKTSQLLFSGRKKKADNVSNSVSKDRVVNELVKTIMEGYDLTSINESYFGEVLKGVELEGYTKTKFGKYDFLVKEGAYSLAGVVCMVEGLSTKIEQDGYVRKPLTKVLDLDGSESYMLCVNMQDLEEVYKIYPQYIYEIEDIDASIDRLTLVIKCN